MPYCLRRDAAEEILQVLRQMPEGRGAARIGRIAVRRGAGQPHYQDRWFPATGTTDRAAVAENLLKCLPVLPPF
jgi:hypothetical protein